MYDGLVPTILLGQDLNYNVVITRKDKEYGNSKIEIPSVVGTRN